MTGYQYVLTKEAQKDVEKFKQEVRDLNLRFFNSHRVFPNLICVNTKCFPDEKDVDGFKLIRADHFAVGTVLLTFGEL